MASVDISCNRSSKNACIVVPGDVDDVGLGAQDGSGASNNCQSIHKHLSCTQKEKQLTLLVTLLLICSFSLLAYLLATGPLSSLLIPKSKGSGFGGICDSAECVDISYRSIQSGDFHLNPCDDFYLFACSKWQAENPTTPEQLYVAANINQMRDRVDIYLKRLLEKPTKAKDNDTEPYVYTSTRAFYESCLNFSMPDESFINLLKPFGGYKSMKNWSEDEFDLTSLILKFLRVNAAPLFDLTLDIDPKDRTKYALIVELPRPTSLVPNLFQPLSRQDDVLITEKLKYDLGETSDFFLMNSSDIDKKTESDLDLSSIVDRQTLYKMITDNVEAKRVERLKVVVARIGKLVNLSDDEAEADANDIALFATNIEKIKPSQRSRKFWKQQNKLYNAFTIDSLQTLFGSVNWKILLSGLLGRRFDGTGEESEIEGFRWENATIYVPYPDYLRRLFQAIQFTNKRILFNGMLVMYVKDMLNDIVPKRKVDDPRWKFCVHSTKSVFTMELSSLYLRSFDPTHLQEVRRDVEEIFRNVKESLLSLLNESHWQDSKSREDSIRKVESLKGNFIAPTFYLNNDYLQLDTTVKKGMRINPKDFYFNVKLVYKIFRQQLYALYLKKVDEEHATWAFAAFPTTVNAFYIAQFNSLVVPLAFLNPPQYVHGAPKYINYATIALTIAHEALHSLDSSGSNFDAEGRLTHHGSNGDQRGLLLEKSGCIARQYFNAFKKIMSFHQTNVFFQVDGNLTQNENLADIAGLQVALNAYQKLRAQSDLESEKGKLPGLPFSLEQIYFLSVAQSYCANISPMGYIFLLEIDEHTPHPERINGMLMNIPEFSTAFGCSVGSKMNPSAKCSLW